MGTIPQRRTLLSILSRIPESLLGDSEKGFICDGAGVKPFRLVSAVSSSRETPFVDISLLFHLFVAQRDVAQQREVCDIGYFQKGVALEAIFPELVLQLLQFLADSLYENFHLPPLGGGLVGVDEEFGDLKPEQAPDVGAVLL